MWVGFDQPQTILPNGFAADVAVPFWAKFMKVATANDKPEWFKTPYGVTTASVCRLSGKLASEECNHVEAVGKDGQIETRSMVYTEYFSRGTEPVEYCDMHSSNGVFGTVAGGLLGQAPRANENGSAPAPVGTSGAFGAPATSSQPRTSTTNSTGTSGKSVYFGQIPPAPIVPERNGGFWPGILVRGGEGTKN